MFAQVTGAGGGLGRGLALRFAKLGCKVACVDVGDAENEITVKQINELHPNCAKPYHCNIGSSEEIRNLRKNVESDFGCINILVNNAGLLYNCKAHEVDEKIASGIVAINLTSHFLVILYYFRFISFYLIKKFCRLWQDRTRRDCKTDGNRR